MNNEIQISKLLENFIISLYKFVRRNIIILNVSVVLGILVGFSVFLFYKNVMINEIIAKSNIYESQKIYEVNISQHMGQELIVTRFDAINAANSLAGLTKKELSKVLHISIEEALKIRRIASDSVVNTDYYFIEIEYEKPVDLKKIEKGIVNYIDSTDYIRHKIELAKEKNEKIISKIDIEMLKLEKFQEAVLNIENNVGKNGDVVVVSGFRNSFHIDMLSFNILRETYVNSIKTATAIELSQSLTFSKKMKVPIVGSFAVSIISFLILGIFISIILDIHKKINGQ